MLRVADVLTEIDHHAPHHYAYSWDNVGLVVGDRQAPVTKMAVSLDSSMAAINYARDRQCQLLLSHHPLLWDPLKSLAAGSRPADEITALHQAKIAFIACHTNWDVAPGGIGDTLAQALGLNDVTPFGSGPKLAGRKLVTFVPQSHADKILDALSQAGAGVIGNYERCAFLQEGTGTFRPNDHADPTIGQRGKTESTPEIRLETIVPPGRETAVINALRNVHPYEEPAFDLYSMVEQNVHSLGRIGVLPAALTPSALQKHVDDSLDTRSQMWLPEEAHAVRKVAVVGGAAPDLWRDALQSGAEVFLTGEVPQHVALEASQAGLVVLAAGHYATEHPGMVELARRLRSRLSLDVTVFEPEPGRAGRPI